MEVVIDDGGRAAAVDYEGIAKRYLPHGYTVEYRKSLSGRHYGERKLIRPLAQSLPNRCTSSCMSAHMPICTPAAAKTLPPGMSRKWRPSSGPTPRWSSTALRSRRR